jgi:hypothetical protein
MDRRVFLKQTTTAAGTLALSPLFGAGENNQRGRSVENVHVIFKTHLDIGFTDLSENVIRTYFESFIPAALSLSERFRKQGRKDRFIWTTGSWLIYEYLEQAIPDNRRRMEEAIVAGDIVWHGLPFTTHSELIDDSLFMLGTALSAKLDKRFGRKTIAAKMTDVPGHSRGIVPLMYKAGLSFLHIGVNPASTPPDVPPLFRWRADGCEVIVMYQAYYGSVMSLPDGRTAVAICFTGDNHGPQSPQQIAKIYEDLRNRFPGAEVFASTLDAVARTALQSNDKLPVITQELGDTWIHGPGSDPRRIAEFRELSRLRRRWLSKGKLEEHCPTDIAFGGKLLMVAEHTWGLDIKTHLKDWSIYGLKELAAARGKPNFQRTERSWAEKRAYITEAVESLPTELADQAKRHLRNLRPKRQSNDGYAIAVKPAAPIETKYFTIAIDQEAGAITTLRDRRTGRNWAGGENLLAVFGYQTFSQKDYDRFFDQYLTQRPAWAISDFGKPGMEADNPGSHCRQARLKEMRIREDAAGHRIVLQLRVPQSNNTGCPRQIINRILLPSSEPAIHIDLAWFDKPAYRLPEAMWLSFSPVITNDNDYLLDKMNHPVSPLDVVADGNRSLHGVIQGAKYADKTGGFELESSDAFLVAPGRKSLLNFDNNQPQLKDGLHFCLCNNVWGTNFMMWFEDDMRFRFKLRFG